MANDLVIRGLWAGPGANPMADPSVRGVDLEVKAGCFVVLAGPNGAGKSTLLRASLGLAPRRAGAVFAGEADILQWSARARARQIGYLAQQRALAWPITTAALVALGRWAHDESAAARRAATQRAINVCRLSALQARRCDSLSGGELARAHVARLLAGETAIMVADEPTAALDPAHAMAVMELLRKAARAGAAVLATSHDLGLAAQFADRIVVLHEGVKVADGAPRDVLTPALTRTVYGVDSAWIDRPDGFLVYRRPDAEASD